MRHKRTGQDERTPEGEGSDYVADTKNGLVVTKAEGVWGQRRGDLLQGCAPQAVQSVGGVLSSWEGADRKLRLIHLFDMATCPCGVGEDS